MKANAERNEPQPICKGIEEYAQKRAKEKLEENLNEIIKSMILEGDISAEKIARWCHTTVEHVEEIRAAMLPKESMRDEEKREEGRAEGRLEILISLVKDGFLNISDAAKRVNMTEDEFKKLI